MIFTKWEVNALFRMIVWDIHVKNVYFVSAGNKPVHYRLFMFGS